jgi:hypothetical protein
MAEDPAGCSAWGEGMGWVVRLVETGVELHLNRGPRPFAGLIDLCIENAS